MNGCSSRDARWGLGAKPPSAIALDFCAQAQQSYHRGWMTRVEIDSVVELPSRRLHVEAAVAGLTAAVVVGGVPGRIGFPRLPVEGVPSRAGQVRVLQAPRMGKGRLPALTMHSVVAGTWGYVSSARGDTFVTALRLRIAIDKDVPTPDAMRALGSDFDSWFRIVRNWLCAWTGQRREFPELAGGCQIHAAVPTGDGELGLFGGGAVLGELIVGERPATRPEVVAALDCASARQDVGLVHELILRARSEGPRRCVIDACAATEVALSSYLRTALVQKGMTAETIKKTLQGADGVVGLFRLALVSGGGFPVSDSRVMDQLAGPRNRAVHQGDALDARVAQRAVETASAIVGAAQPLPSPSHARRAARQLGRRAETVAVER